MSKKKEKKPVSGFSIFIAWILLIIFLSAGVSLTYLKFFGSYFVNDDSKISSSDTDEESKVILNALDGIVKNFNENSKISEYKAQNIIIESSLDGENIVVNYNDSSNNYSYKFNFDIPVLSVSVANSENDVFKNIFTMMIYANQKRLGNEVNIDSYINGFYAGSLEVSGLSSESLDDSIKYSLDISKKIGQDNTNIDNISSNENNSAANSANNQ